MQRNNLLATNEELMKELGVSWSYLRDLRKGNKYHPPKLIEGVHWFKVSHKVIRYNRPLVLKTLGVSVPRQKKNSR